VFIGIEGVEVEFEGLPGRGVEYRGGGLGLSDGKGRRNGRGFDDFFLVYYLFWLLSGRETGQCEKE
jgi:hypothetical protein